MILTLVGIVPIGANYFQSGISIGNTESRIGAPLIAAGSSIYLVSVMMGLAHFAWFCDSCDVQIQPPQQPKNGIQSILFEYFGRLYSKNSSVLTTNVHGFLVSQPLLLWILKGSDFVCLVALVIFSVSFGNVRHARETVTNHIGHYLFACAAPVVVLLAIW